MTAEELRDKINELTLIRDGLTDEIQKAHLTIQRGIEHRKKIDQKIAGLKSALKRASK